MDISKVSGAWNFAFRSRSNIGHFLHHTWPKHSYTPLDASKPHKNTYSSSICSQTPSPGISGQIRTTADTIRLQQTPNDTKRHQQTSPDTQKGRSRQRSARSIFQLSRREREFLIFNLAHRDETENFCHLISCFETRPRIISFNLSHRDEIGIYFSQSQTTRREREFLKSFLSF